MYKYSIFQVWFQNRRAKEKRLKKDANRRWQSSSSAASLGPGNSASNNALPPAHDRSVMNSSGCLNNGSGGKRGGGKRKKGGKCEVGSIKKQNSGEQESSSEGNNSDSSNSENEDNEDESISFEGK